MFSLMHVLNYGELTRILRTGKVMVCKQMVETISILNTYAECL